MRLLAAVGVAGFLGGCSVVSDVAALAAGGAAGGATGNPAVGFAVGVGVRAGVEEVQRYVTRVRWRGEQDAIADIAGAAPVGKVQSWEIQHTIPLGNRRGDLAVLREFTTPLTACREVAFSVVERRPEVFTTMLCRNGDRWRWAVAEPAVDRWGFLQ